MLPIGVDRFSDAVVKYLAEAPEGISKWEGAQNSGTKCREKNFCCAPQTTLVPLQN